MLKIVATLGVVALLGLPSRAMADDMKMDMAKPGTTMSEPGSSPRAGGDADKAFKAAMDRMMSGMDVRPTGTPDADFVTMMMPHHQGAIDMAKVELQYGSDPMLRKMARDIVSAQETEIAEMRTWQAKHRK